MEDLDGSEPVALYSPILALVSPIQQVTANSSISAAKIPPLAPKGIRARLESPGAIFLVSCNMVR